MVRKHYSPNHPAVIAWREVGHKTVAERRAEVVARARAGKKQRTYKGQAFVGVVMSVGAFVAYSRAEWHDTGEWWTLTGILAGGGVALLVNAIYHSN
jgi:hypothetical protein